MATRRVSENSSNCLVCYDVRRYLWGRFVRRVVLPIESVFLDRGHVEANGVSGMRGVIVALVSGGALSVLRVEPTPVEMRDNVAYGSGLYQQLATRLMRQLDSVGQTENAR
jgi:hypothetical protein